MENQLLALLGAVVALSVAASFDASADRVARAVAIGSFVGMAIAYRRQRRRPDLDPSPVIARWSFVGLAGGLLRELVLGLP